MKRIVCLIFTALLACTFLLSNGETASAYTFTPEQTIKSDAAILYNMDTEQVLYEKNTDQTETPGHLVQIMTAIVVMEKCDDISNTKIVANSNLYTPLYQYEDVDDLRYADIDDGDTLTVEEYLYAMMLTSSCEAALILADNYGGVNGFVESMNEKAEELGCTQTYFTNPTGLYDSKQVTTAEDMLTIVNYALSLDGFEQIATTKEYSPKTPNTENHPNEWTWTHSNNMMDDGSENYYEGCKGIKTSNINRAGRSIITMATREGMTYLVILMNAPFEDSEGELQYYHLEDASYLFDWAFEHFSYVTLLESSEEIAEVPVKISDGNGYVLVHPEDNCIVLWCDTVDTTAVEKSVTLSQNINAPVKKGDVLGSMELKFSGETIATVPLVAVKNVNRSFTKYNLYALKNFHHSGWLKVGIIAGCIITLIYLGLCIMAYYRAKKAVTPQQPVKIVPHATYFDSTPRKNLRRDDSVYYHGPRDRDQDRRE